MSTTTQEKAIPHGSTVLVTGAAGFIGAAIVQLLLKEGYKVRGTTRSIAKIEPLKKKLDAEFGEGAFQVVKVEDFSKAGAYDESLKGVSGLIHVAGDVSLSPDHDKVVNGTIEGIYSILRSAAKIPSLKRVVLTSSRIAIFHPQKGDNYKVDNNSYNDTLVKASQDAAADHPFKHVFAYAAGKTLGEKAVWKFVSDEKPHYVVNTVLPDLVTGEIINPASEGSTSGFFNKLFTKGDVSSIYPFVESPPFYVDVKDTARIHLAALIEPDVQNERLWALAGPFTLNEILGIWRSAYPNRSLPPDYEGLGERTQIQVDNTRSTELLKRQGRSGWVSLKDSVLEQVKGL